MFSFHLILIFNFKHGRYLQRKKKPLSSGSEMTLKELESSQLSSFIVNLTGVFKVTTKYRRKIISKYRQTLLFIT